MKITIYHLNSCYEISELFPDGINGWCLDKYHKALIPMNGIV